MGKVRSIYLKNESDWELMKSEAAKADRSVSGYLVRLVRGSISGSSDISSAEAKTFPTKEMVDDDIYAGKKPIKAVKPKPDDSAKAKKLAMVQKTVNVQPASEIPFAGSYSKEHQTRKKGK